MKSYFYPETDSLYIELSPKPGVEANEIARGIVSDYDKNKNVVGIDIDLASFAPPRRRGSGSATY